MNDYFRFEENGKLGLKNTKGEVILKPIYDDIWIARVDKGFIKAKLNNKWGLFYLQGHKILEPIYDFIYLDWVRDGLIHVKLNGKYGLFDTEGNQLLPCKYDQETALFELYKKKFKIKKDLLK